MWKSHRPRLGLAWVYAAISLLTNGSAASADVLVFTGARVFDGARCIPDQSIVVKDGFIASITADGVVPDGATVIDGRGKTLLPGLIDAHTHSFAVDQLRAALIFGVTTELDMFTMPSFAASRRAEQAAGDAVGRADLFSAGTLVTAPGGHGTEYGFPIPTMTRPDQADAFVAARLAEGSDYIKIVYDDGSEVGLPWKTLDKTTLTAVVNAARARKKLAVVHVLAREFARGALEAGADGLVHLFVDRPVDDAFVRLAVDRKAFVIPTLTVLDSVNRGGGNAALASDRSLAPYLTPDDIQNLKAHFPGKTQTEEVLKIPRDTVKALAAAGVRILAGTDCGNPGTTHGASLHRELALLVAAGLTPSAALAAATAQTAEAFKLSDRGRIAPGLRADLVLVDGDPTVDITVTRKIVGVWKQGRPIDRAQYRAAIEQKAKALATLKAAAPPPGSESGLITDFEGEKATTKTRFGAGLMISTDAMRGGKSKVATGIVEGGANGSAHALKLTGTIADNTAGAWAGILFSPGSPPMSPANLSGKTGFSFWAKGEGKPAYVMIFSQAHGFIPSIETFIPPKEWTRFSFDWNTFDGVDGSGILGIFLGSGATPGPFEMKIDDLRLEPSARP